MHAQVTEHVKMAFANASIIGLTIILKSVQRRVHSLQMEKCVQVVVLVNCTVIHLVAYVNLAGEVRIVAWRALELMKRVLLAMVMEVVL